MKAKHLNKFAFTASALLITLSPISIRLTLTSYLLILAILAINLKNVIKSEISKELLSFAFIIIIATATGIWGNFYTNNLIKLIGMSAFCLGIIACYKSKIINHTTIIYSCNIIILVHSLLFITQLIYHVATGQYLDITNILRDQEADALYLSNALEGKTLGIRATGAYTEPSFYAMTVLSAAGCILIFRKKLTLAVLVALITSCISLSVAAVIVSALLSFLILLRFKASKGSKTLILALGLSATPFFFSFYEARVIQSADYDAISSRLLVVHEIAERGIIKNLIGEGILWDDRKPIGANLLTGYHVRDSSFYIYLLYTAGVLSLILYLFFLRIICKGNISALFIFSALMLFKFHILHGVFWLTVAFVYISSQSIQEKSNINAPTCA